MINQGVMTEQSAGPRLAIEDFVRFSMHVNVLKTPDKPQSVLTHDRQKGNTRASLSSRINSR